MCNSNRCLNLPKGYPPQPQSLWDSFLVGPTDIFKFPNKISTLSIQGKFGDVNDKSRFRVEGSGSRG